MIMWRLIVFYKIHLMLASNLPWLIAATGSFWSCTHVTGGQPATQFSLGLQWQCNGNAILLDAIIGIQKGRLSIVQNLKSSLINRSCRLIDRPLVHTAGLPAKPLLSCLFLNYLLITKYCYILHLFVVLTWGERLNDRNVLRRHTAKLAFFFAWIPCATTHISCEF